MATSRSLNLYTANAVLAGGLFAYRSSATNDVGVMPSMRFAAPYATTRQYEHGWDREGDVRY